MRRQQSKEWPVPSLCHSGSWWEESVNSKVIDPYLVVRHSLINANSIAGMLITTTSLIINEYKNNYNKENEYNNW